MRACSNAGALHGVSPILRTLTYSFSEDTVLFLAFVCFMLHLVMFDYSYSAGSSDKFKGVISLNMAVLGSTILSSLLPDDLSVFAFLALAIESFALYRLESNRPRVTMHD